MVLSKTIAISLKTIRRLSQLRQIPQFTNQINLPTAAITKQSTRLLVTLQTELTQELTSVYARVLKDVETFYPDWTTANDLQELKDHALKIVDYNTRGGKYIRGCMLLEMYKMMEEEKNLTTENIALASILGWCLEIRQGAFVLVDDIVDQSITRRGKICWYRNKEVGFIALNDYGHLESVVQFLLQKHFSQHSSFSSMLEIIYHMKWITVMGETMDLNSMDKDGPKLNLFSMKRYETVAHYKTGYYTFYSPLHLAMNLANCLDEELYHKVEDITKEFGIFYQKQDDYLDCYGNPVDSGKHGTDIKEGKCTWFVVRALEKATPMQRKLLRQYYGRKDGDSENVIYNLYNEMNLRNEFISHEQEESLRIRDKINRLPEKLPKDLFIAILKYIFKRKV